jgi:hypothetical protein
MTIPPDEREGLRRLAMLTNDQVTDLKAKLAASKLLLDRDEFTKSIPAVEGVSQKDLRQIISSLIYVHSFPGSPEFPVSQFLSDISESTFEEEEDRQVAANLAKRLESLMAIDSLRLRAKVVDLQVDHQQSFQNARVFTDVRPVFDSTSPDKICGALVFHTLKIEYFDTESREAFFALDDRDVATLKNLLARAETKAKTIRASIIARLNLDDFGVSPDREKK